MSDSRHLLLLRHAEAEATRPGHHDRDRRLTTVGRARAEAVGSIIRAEGWHIDHVSCSSAIRTRETLTHLGLPDATHVTISESLYNAGSDSIVEAIRHLPDEVRTALVVGHAPGVPGVIFELVNPETADPVDWARVEAGYPPGTLTVLELSNSWDDLSVISLIALHPAPA